jgi:hypothetical protein
MILLVSGATSTLRGLPLDAPVGHLVTPHTGNRIADIATTGRPWAADNGCFIGLDERAFLTMLRTIEALPLGLSRPLWVVVPDVVADARATAERWAYWSNSVRASVGGWQRCAFVAQDGAESLRLPWDKFGCLFIGGSTEWKESDAAATLIVKAKALGKHVHVGRVNTERRVRLFDGLGIDTIDGTQFSRFPDTYIPRWAERLRPSLRGRLAKPQSLPMFEEAA